MCFVLITSCQWVDIRLADWCSMRLRLSWTSSAAAFTSNSIYVAAIPITILFSRPIRRSHCFMKCWTLSKIRSIARVITQPLTVFVEVSRPRRRIATAFWSENPFSIDLTVFITGIIPSRELMAKMSTGTQDAR
jgi:hypothetical protein